MSKEKSDKKDKKEKKREKLGEDGVKKDKKDKKRKSTDAATATLNAIEDSSPGAVAVDADGDVVIDASLAQAVETEAKGDKFIIPQAALVPFANPLADDKSGKKVLKTVKKGTVNPLNHT